MPREKKSKRRSSNSSSTDPPSKKRSRSSSSSSSSASSSSSSASKRSSKSDSSAPRTRPRANTPTGTRCDSRKETEIRIKNLSRNVTQGHLLEIFSTFGEVRRVIVEVDECVNLPKGQATIAVPNDTPHDEEKTHQLLRIMDGACIDGQKISCKLIKPIRKESKDPQRRRHRKEP